MIGTSRAHECYSAPSSASPPAPIVDATLLRLGLRAAMNVNEDQECLQGLLQPGLPQRIRLAKGHNEGLATDSSQLSCLLLPYARQPTFPQGPHVSHKAVLTRIASGSCERWYEGGKVRRARRVFWEDRSQIFWARRELSEGRYGRCSTSHCYHR